MDILNKLSLYLEATCSGNVDKTPVDKNDTDFKKKKKKKEEQEDEDEDEADEE